MQQLNREYCGLTTKYSDSTCVLIFLVPTDDGELSGQVKRAYNSFDQAKLRTGEFLKLMTWQENNASHPSVIALLEGLLHDEAAGRTEPISDYTRHTIKALIMFIRGGFCGYDFERIKKQNVDYPRIKIEDILRKTGGIVGVYSGIKGLLRLSAGTVNPGTDILGSRHRISPCRINCSPFGQQCQML